MCLGLKPQARKLFVYNVLFFPSFLTENDVCCLMICEKSYAAVLAFSFLDDIKKEFLQQYPKPAIEQTVRPYSFIEFGNNFFPFFYCMLGSILPALMHSSTSNHF